MCPRGASAAWAGRHSLVSLKRNEKARIQAPSTQCQAQSCDGTSREHALGSSVYFNGVVDREARPRVGRLPGMLKHDDGSARRLPSETEPLGHAGGHCRRNERNVDKADRGRGDTGRAGILARADSLQCQLQRWPTFSDNVRLGIPFAPRTSFEHAASPAAALKR
jgi:hypothetical protein